MAGRGPEALRINPNGVVSRFHFMSHAKEARDGKPGRAPTQVHVDFFNFPGAPVDPNRNNFTNPNIAPIVPKIERFIRKTWENYSDTTVANTVKKFKEFSRFAFAYTPEGEMVAFNAYKVGETPTKVGPAKTIYVEHAGTHPDFQGMGITQGMRNAFFAAENPDIICGSSANQLIYAANKKIAERQGMAFYPRLEEGQLYVPAPIGELGGQILDELNIKNAKYDPETLKRTYEGEVAPSQGEHELAKAMNLDPEHDHVFYILVNSRLNRSLLAA